jgi:histidyl-tRNA synthetase
MIEAELMALYIEGYKALDIDVVLKYNNRKIMQGMIENEGITGDKVSDVITVIDKFDKLTPQEIKIEFTNVGLDSDTITNLLEVFKLDFDGIKNKYKDNDNINLIEGIQEIEELNTYIDGLGLSSVSSFSPVLARGQSYYTGVVFEVYEKNGIISSAIGGGGRYDNLITDFINDGNKYPAVGVSFGLDVIYTIIKDRDEFKNSSLLDLYIIPLDTELESLKIANKLRSMGYNIEIDSSKRKIGKSINFADKANIENILILGSDEVDNKEFNIKNLITKEIIKVKYDDELKFKKVN